MASSIGWTLSEVTALVVAPNPSLSNALKATLRSSQGFLIVLDLQSYPSQNTLSIRLRQLRPDVLFLEMDSDPNSATELVRCALSAMPGITIVGLSNANNPELLLASLRLGVSEFLYSPFDSGIQLAALARLRSLKSVELVPPSPQGHLIAFSSTKPGAGCTTIATQVAFELHRATKGSVFLSHLDAIQESQWSKSEQFSAQPLLPSEKLFHAADAAWQERIRHHEGIDVLPAEARLHIAELPSVLEAAKRTFDWTIVDLPVIFEVVSLTVVSNVDRVVLLCTPELPSVHLARRAVVMLNQLGVPSERYEVVINRSRNDDNLVLPDLAKLFGCTVQSKCPNNFHSALALKASPATADSSPLGKALTAMTARVITSFTAAGQDGQSVSPN